MQTSIHPSLAGRPEIEEAESILRSCVHCGFCTATCPTYQLLGDELDGPRGRIYLIKNLLETNEIDAGSAEHLDRCLTCRACETTCPSGVKYGRLADIGRGLAADRVARPLRDRVLIWGLRHVIPRVNLFTSLIKLGQSFRALLPSRLKRQVPAVREAIPPAVPVPSPLRRVALLDGCVQRGATPNVNAALRQILSVSGIECVPVPDEGCCGALDYHLSAHEAGEARMRRLIDACESVGADQVVSSASGCGVTIKEYPVYLKNDVRYATRARDLSDKTVDAVELIADVEWTCRPVKVAVHTPCTLQHGQGVVGQIEALLAKVGADIVPVRESHLCCGSAGTYSILRPELAGSLRTRKLGHLAASEPEVIVTANIGCQLHLQNDDVPVMHWAEFLWAFRATIP